jgi:predicted transcriptional regulator
LGIDQGLAIRLTDRRSQRALGQVDKRPYQVEEQDRANLAAITRRECWRSAKKISAQLATSFASVGNPAYDASIMAKAKKFDLEAPVPVLDEEDEETLAAIDEGVRDAQAGRTVPAEEARKQLPQWITASSTLKGH